MERENRKIAVVIPCYNEAQTIGKVVEDFKRELPDAEIYVYDNNSKDRTAEVAKRSGAKVRFCTRQGKGMVVRQMFAEVSADVYVMVDGDDTYTASDVHALLAPVLDGTCDLCVGNRLQRYARGSFALFHLFGNRLIKTMMERFYLARIDDMLSGYRVLTREVVEDLTLISTGFEIETEINIRAVWRGYRIVCVPTIYKKRPEGSVSKIRLFSDGYRILATMLVLLREHQPVTMAGYVLLMCTLLAAAGMASGLHYGNVYLFTGALALLVCGVTVICTGIVLNATNWAHRESEVREQKLIRLLKEYRSETDR